MKTMKIEPLLNPNALLKIHFIGIGGVSMRGLAEILHRAGHQVSGTDMEASKNTHELANMGISIAIPHHAENLHHPDLVVYTAAISKNNPEYLKALEKNIETMDRATLLGRIMHEYTFSIACCGTHGKTTTSNMVANLLLKAQKKPTIHVGGGLSGIHPGTLAGSKHLLVAEACEYVDSFLKLHPSAIIISNIELDHVDYFRDLAHIQESFVTFANQTSPDGFVVANADDPNTLEILPRIQRRIVTYGIENPLANFNAQEVVYSKTPSFMLSYSKNPKTEIHQAITRISLKLPGSHNISNALSAIAGCLTSFPDISSQVVQEAFQDFMGASRRFQQKGTRNGITIVDDYAHHPTEIKATLSAAKSSTQGSVFCVFQPHTYSRTKAFLASFSDALKLADDIILTDIYAAREVEIQGISSQNLVKQLHTEGIPCTYISDFKSVANVLLEKAKPGDLIITMGAGDVYKIADLLLDI